MSKRHRVQHKDDDVIRGDELERIENEKGQILHEYFKSIFDENPRHLIMKQYNDQLNGNDVNLNIGPIFDHLNISTKCWKSDQINIFVYS